MQFCLNQCNGRGTCKGGYCHCDLGWHGIDCAHRSAAVDAIRPGSCTAVGRSTCLGAASAWIVGGTTAVKPHRLLSEPAPGSLLLLQGERQESPGWQTTCTPRLLRSLNRGPLACARSSMCELAWKGVTCVSTCCWQAGSGRAGPLDAFRLGHRPSRGCHTPPPPAVTICLPILCSSCCSTGTGESSALLQRTGSSKLTGADTACTGCAGHAFGGDAG